MQNSIAHITTEIKTKALELGFDACGISKAEFLEEDAERLKTWLQNNMHGQMHYMANNFDKRTDPTLLVENTKSVISVILNYYPGEIQHDPEAPVLSKYAYGMDYHFVLKKKLKSLLYFVNEHLIPVQGRAFVDSAPVLDRAWAAKSGLGWIGKNTNLISPKHGSFIFIGNLLVDVELEYDMPIKDFCGGCNKCIQACPTNALLAPRLLDARKCISYLTIENKDDTIPGEFKGQFKNRVYGCDICQDVCPWNRSVKPHQVDEFTPHPDLLGMLKDDWHNLDEEKYRSLFKNSAVKRAKFKGLMRNLEFLKNV